MPVSRDNDGGDCSETSPRPSGAKPETAQRPGRHRRPYRRRYASIAKKLCQLGATIADLAESFEVDQRSIRLWQVNDKEFSEACRLGAEHAVERMEQSLYQRAVGYDHDAEKVVSHKGRSAIVKYRVHVPADVSAAIFFDESLPGTLEASEQDRACPQ